MNKLRGLFQDRQRPLFMTHLIAGFPTLAISEQVGRAMLKAGADILELQIPFSDPMADGPSIAEACQDALSNGASVRKSLVVAEKLSRGTVPVVMMSYINPVFRYGIAKFVRDASSAGVSGLIIPDAPFDSPEGVALLEAAKKYDVSLIPVISPGVPRERLAHLSGDSGGFVYCTSRQGTTGANSKFARELAEYLRMAEREFDIPIGLGFGVRTRADFKSAAKLADIVIAGSVFVNAIRAAKKGREAESVLRVVKALTG